MGCPFSLGGGDITPTREVRSVKIRLGDVFHSHSYFLRFITLIRFCKADISSSVSPERSIMCLLSVFSMPSRKSVVTLNAFDMETNVTYDGSRKPFSYAEITDFVTPIFRASSPCVSLFCTLKFFNLLPNSTISIHPPDKLDCNIYCVLNWWNKYTNS